MPEIRSRRYEQAHLPMQRRLRSPAAEYIPEIRSMLRKGYTWAQIAEFVSEDRQSHHLEPVTSNLLWKHYRRHQERERKKRKAFAAANQGVRPDPSSHQDTNVPSNAPSAEKQSRSQARESAGGQAQSLKSTVSTKEPVSMLELAQRSSPRAAEDRFTELERQANAARFRR